MKRFLKASKLEGSESFVIEKRKKLYRRRYTGGLQVALKGRLKGVKRARKMVYHYGSVAPNCLKKGVKCNENPINTKWGIWNLQVSLYRSKIKPRITNQPRLR